MLCRALVGMMAIAFAAWPSGAQQAATLRVGDKAPAIAVGGWLRGDPVPEFKPGRVYVVELGATWAPMMAESVGVLTDIQKRFADRGVTVVGVFVRENQRAEPGRFVRDRGAAIGYAMAFDDVPAPPGGTPDDRLWAMENGRMSLAWLRASGRDKLPSAFIVDGAGALAWAGQATHPRGELEEALTRVLAGTLSPAESAALSADFREREDKLERASVRYRQAMARRDYPAAMAIMDEQIALAPKRVLNDAKFVGPKMALMLTELKDEDAAYTFARSVADGEGRDNPKVLHAIAAVILEARGLARRDLDFALSLAQRADELTEHRIPLVLDTLARAYHDRGDLDAAIQSQTKAIEQQRSAVAVAPADYRRAAETDLATLEATLKRYQDEKARDGGG